MRHVMGAYGLQKSPMRAQIWYIAFVESPRLSSLSATCGSDAPGANSPAS